MRVNALIRMGKWKFPVNLLLCNVVLLLYLQPMVMNQCFFSSIYCELWKESIGLQVTSQLKETVFAHAVGGFYSFYKSTFHLFRSVVHG